MKVNYALDVNHFSHSAGLVARRHGQVARAAHSILWLIAAILVGLTYSPNIDAATTNAVPSTQEVLRDTLTNGLQVVIVRNSLAPVVTTVMNYRAGSDEAPPGFPGTAHAQEHMMFRGSPGLSAAQL